MRTKEGTKVKCDWLVEERDGTERRRCGKPAEYEWDEQYEPEPLLVCVQHARILGQPYEVFDVTEIDSPSDDLRELR
jgi:hypothetical protein